MNKTTIYKISKEEIKDLNIELPTTKTSQLIIRQKGHYLGDWEIFKPTRKHQYFIKLI